MPLRQRQISLSELACQAQAAKQAEVLELVRQELSRQGEALRDQAVERERHERIGKKQVLLVALGVLADGRFEVLDWQAADSESPAGYERLLNRLDQRGLETVELIVADQAASIASSL